MAEKETTLNKAQLVLLKAMRTLKTEEEVRELQRAIARFFADRADREMDRLWESGIWNAEKQAALEHAHYRTPYSRSLFV